MAAYLVSIEGLRGPEAQIWYGEPGKFVGPPINAVAKIVLPERPEPWSIDEALNLAHRNPDAGKV